MTIGVSGNAVDAAHLDDRALAAQFVEQPFGAELGVFDLIVGQNISLRRGNRLIDRDHHDALVRRLLDDGVQRFAIGRIDDDDVRASRDEIADVGDLLRRTAIAVGDNDLRDLARRFRLGLDRADHLFAPAVADQRIGDADDILVRRLRFARRRQHGE